MPKDGLDESKNPRIGVVLSSGGMRGVYAHTGFMQAIQNLGIPLYASAGCSAGALVGGFIASGTSIEAWAASLAKVSKRDFWTPDALPRMIWDVIFNKGRGYSGISDTKAAQQFIRQNLTAKTFDECIHPFHVLANNLGSGKKQLFSEGELAPRMIASAAMPILYKPVRIDGKYYCDGALIDFAPTDAICCRHKLDVIIVNHVSQYFSDYRDIDSALHDRWAIMEVVNRLVFPGKPWYLTGKSLSLHHCPCECGAVIIAIEAELPTMRWFDIRGGDTVCRRAREQTEFLLRPYLDTILNDPREHLL